MQARGKKNLVISQELAGPVGLFVKFSVLQEYGVDRVFLLENANIDSSQRNVVFLVRGEKAQHVRTVAGRSCLFSPFSTLLPIVDLGIALGTSVDCADVSQLYVTRHEIGSLYHPSSYIGFHSRHRPFDSYQSELTFKDHRTSQTSTEQWKC